MTKIVSFQSGSWDEKREKVLRYVGKAELDEFLAWFEEEEVDDSENYDVSL